MFGPNILLVEDNQADQALALEALKHSKFHTQAHVVSDGREAIDFLTRSGKHNNAPLPDLIILDLNLPGMDGRHLLEQIRNKLALPHIPVVILTSSSASEDIARCYELCANSYVQKPADLDDFFSAITAIENYWFRVSTLPTIAG